MERPRIGTSMNIRRFVGFPSSELVIRRSYFGSAWNDRWGNDRDGVNIAGAGKWSKSEPPNYSSSEIDLARAL